MSYWWNDQKMPTKWHVRGMPVYWTGETRFQIARPEVFKCPKAGKNCTLVLGRKTEIRKTSNRPKDVLPEVLGHMVSQHVSGPTWGFLAVCHNTSFLVLPLLKVRQLWNILPNACPSQWPHGKGIRPYQKSLVATVVGGRTPPS